MKRDHMEILLEDLHSKFDIVIEGHTALDAKMEHMRRELTERIDHVDFKVEVFNNSLNKKIDSLAAKVEEVDAKVEGLDAKVKGLDAKVEGLDNSLNDKIDTLATKLDAVAADLAAHRADTEAHHGIYRVRESGD